MILLKTKIYISQLKAGLIDKMSFAFTTTMKNTILRTDTRTIKSIDKLWDVSVVMFLFMKAQKYMLGDLDTSKRNTLKRRKDKC